MQPDDCYQAEPEVLAGNAEAWKIYKLLDTRWRHDFGGYRVAYDATEAMQLASHLEWSGGSILDLLERFKTIETTVRDGEARRRDLDDEEAERKRKHHANKR